MPNIKIDGITIHYQEWGDHASPPLLLLHGLGGNATIWKNQVLAFSREYRMIAVDLRGAGKSDSPDAPGCYEIERLAKDIIGLTSALGISSMHLLGASLGGYIAQKIAIDMPSLCKSLILAHTESNSKSFAKNLQSRINMIDTLSTEEFSDRIAEQALHNANDPATVKWISAHLALIKKNVYKQILKEAMSNFDMDTRIPEIKIPTLVIAGKNDTVISASASEELARQLPSGQLVTMIDVGHLSYIESPESFNTAVLTFLNQTASST